MKFRKRPVEIDALRWDGSNVTEIASFVGCPAAALAHQPDLGTIHIHTREGTMAARTGDMIIRGVAGEFYPCKPDIFAATYEPAE